MTLLLLEAFEHVHARLSAKHELLAAEVDRRVRENEPGMLLHLHTKVSENKNEIVYRWTEVFKSARDLDTHLEALHVQEYGKKTEETYCAPIDIIIYCDWSEEQKALWLKKNKLSVKFALQVCAYFSAL